MTRRDAIKQANERGLTRAGQIVVSLLTFITDVNTVGLKAAQGPTFVTALYWDRDDESRAWSRRFFECHKRRPSMAQATVYSAIRHDLRAIAAAGTDEEKTVMAKMREIPVNDFYVKTAAWFTSCISCRSKRPRNRPALGLLQDLVDYPERSSFSSLGRERLPLVKQ